MDPDITGEDEASSLRRRFASEGLDYDTIDVESRPVHVWRWVVDAEENLRAVRHMNDKLWRQHDEEKEALESYSERVRCKCEERVREMENEVRELKDDLRTLLTGTEAVAAMLLKEGLQDIAQSSLGEQIAFLLVERAQLKKELQEAEHVTKPSEKSDLTKELEKLSDALAELEDKNDGLPASQKSDGKEEGCRSSSLSHFDADQLDVLPVRGRLSEEEGGENMQEIFPSESTGAVSSMRIQVVPEGKVDQSQERGKGETVKSKTDQGKAGNQQGIVNSKHNSSMIRIENRCRERRLSVEQQMEMYKVQIKHLEGEVERHKTLWEVEKSFRQKLQKELEALRRERLELVCTSSEERSSADRQSKEVAILREKLRESQDANEKLSAAVRELRISALIGGWRISSK